MENVYGDGWGEIKITFTSKMTFNTNLPDAEILKMTKVGFYLRLKSFFEFTDIKQQRH